jgi:hypothetical protein
LLLSLPCKLTQIAKGVLDYALGGLNGEDLHQIAKPVLSTVCTRLSSGGEENYQNVKSVFFEVEPSMTFYVIAYFR